MIYEAYEKELGTIAFPEAVRQPAVLRRKVGDLTPAELQTLPDVMAAYEQEKTAADAARLGYRERQNEVYGRFQIAVLAEYGEGLTAAQLDHIWTAAWEDGHAHGMYAVEYAFDRLSGLARSVGAVALTALVKLKDAKDGGDVATHDALKNEAWTQARKVVRGKAYIV